MKMCGCHNFRRHRDIKNGDKYINLDISLTFGSLDKMKITSSHPNDYLRRPGKGLINLLGIKTIGSSKKNKKARYDINNVSMKDLSNIIKEFEKLPWKGYVRKRLKHAPTDSYFYLSRQLAKCMTISDAFNFHVEPVKTEETGMQHIPISHVCSSDKSKSKGIIVDEKLSQVCFTDASES